MSNIERVEPQVVDGIEFYVNNDGSKSGVSQSGLARLCGVGETTIRDLLRKISSSSVRGLSTEKIVEDLSGKEIHLAVTNSKQAKVISSEIAARIITYYAFESKNPTDIAKYSLTKFASMGFDRWVKSLTGFQSDNSKQLLESINETMGKLLVKVERLEQIEEETLGYRKATVTMPVLEKWMAELTQLEKQKILEPSEELFTIKECVEKIYPNCTISTTILKKLALKVSQTVNALSDKPVSKKDTPNGRGFSMRVNAYTAAQIPLIRLCLQSIMAEF